MNRIMNIILCAVWLAVPLHAVRITGTVTDAVTGKAISGVLVQLNKYEGRYPGFTTSVTTDASGKYSINYTPTAIVDPGQLGYYRAENVRFAVFTMDGRCVGRHAGTREIEQLENALPRGMYLAVYEVDGAYTAARWIINGHGSTMPAIKKEYIAKLAAAASLQTDTLVSFSRDGYTTNAVIKNGTSYNMKLYPRTALNTKPGSGNTGPTGPLVLGGGSALVPGGVASGYYFPSALTITASGITLKNFIIDGTGFLYALETRGGTITIEDGEIRNAAISGTNGSGLTARRINIHDHGDDGLKAGSGLDIQWCWVHHLGWNPEAHADGVQFGSGGNSVFKYNNFDMGVSVPDPYKSNATLLIQPQSGAIDNILIESNWLNGGNYTLYARDKGIGYPTNVRIINNKFGRDKRYGLLSGQVQTWSGNVWEDNGLPAN